ncbi:hypothetical protein LA080_010551 [Diaporthe eres]|nr:hypothetical protein LA080_010551 [Diaporthe eres]
MCRRTLLVLFGVSFILIMTDVHGRPMRSALPIPMLTQTTQDIHKDPFQAPHLEACDSENVIPGKYTVILKHGYPLEQHKETIGANLSSSIAWVARAIAHIPLHYSATLDNATLAVVLEDVGVNWVECNCELEPEPRFEPETPVPYLERMPMLTSPGGWRCSEVQELGYGDAIPSAQEGVFDVSHHEN